MIGAALDIVRPAATPAWWRPQPETPRGAVTPSLAAGHAGD